MLKTTTLEGWFMLSTNDALKYCLCMQNECVWVLSSGACECQTLRVMTVWRKRREAEKHVSVIGQQSKADDKGFQEFIVDWGKQKLMLI